jgi:hypothetical protein
MKAQLGPRAKQSIALLLLIVFAAYVVVVSAGPSRQLRDVETDWVVLQAVRAGLDPFTDVGRLAENLGESINRPGLSELDDGPWIHPRTPGALLVLYPLALVGMETATFLLLAVSGAVLIWLALVAVPRLSGLEVETVLLWTVPLLASAPVFSAFEFGTQSIVICALVAVGWLNARTGDGWVGGVALGVAGVLKLWPLLLVVPLAAQRRWRMVATSLGTAMILMLVGFFVTDTTLGTTMAALQAASERWVGFSHNGSFGAVAARLGIEPLVLLAPLAVAGSGISWMAAKRSLDSGLAFAIVVGLLVVPLSWEHYNVSLLLVSAWFLGTQTKGRAFVWTSVGIAALGMAARSPNRQDLPVVGLATMAERLLVLGALCYVLGVGASAQDAAVEPRREPDNSGRVI